MAKKPTGQLNTWEERMAKDAAVASKVESKMIERPFFSASNGQVKFQGALLPNGAPIIVLDQIAANLYYETEYDPNSPVPPDCYALGRFTEDGEIVGVDTWDGRLELAPHKDCTKRVHTDCATCPFNQFNSAAKGKGKACQNTRRLGVIQAGSMAKDKFQPFTDPAQIEGAQVGYIKLPVMSVASYSKVVRDTAEVLGRPMWSMFSLLTSQPNPKGGRPSHLTIIETLDQIPNNLMPAVVKRYDEVSKDLAFAFQARTEADEAAKPKKPAAGGRRKYT